ncbi:hypothetical protein W97_04685 [Coniosporium apollinis CBS 100218]|uniref:BZIP domain-containing protein n=1 Tax=Coniosporium apollinis (strain CBS 100218) TaxID=1168221 RepID=R7YU57_CONA1|nr:uncharacterized protein W97_04685 [Coniosporium apollinis CBS 100218]EON65447.1 hypothetical protein W97_04685 [Coniosporium apollinis CBS 100218]
MTQQAKVHAPQEDWTGVTDSRLRRKLQNRLNQRSRRKREAYTKTTGHIPPAAQSITSRIYDDSSVSGSRWSTQIIDSSSPEVAVVVSTALEPQVKPRKLGQWANTYAGEADDIQQTVLNQLEELASQKYMGSPTADFLLTLIQFNVFRALLRNTFTLRLTLDWLQDDAFSPFCAGHFNESAPSSLQPTLLQRTTEHHPWIDLFPFPAMRDNLLRIYGKFDEDQLCGDLVGWCRSPGERTGLIVWSEPWDPSGWEATEAFLKTWGWTIRGCREISYSTNYWRARRGEEPLEDALFELSA